MLLRQLDKMARKEGGAVFMLNGNHESLNVCGDYRLLRFSFALSRSEKESPAWSCASPESPAEIVYSRLSYTARYVTAGAFVEAAMAAGLKNEQAEVWENQLRARVRLYSPGNK